MKVSSMRLFASTLAFLVLAGCGSGGIPPTQTTTTTPSTAVYSRWSFAGSISDPASPSNGAAFIMDGVLAVDGTKATFKDGFSSIGGGPNGPGACEIAAFMVPSNGGLIGTLSDTDLSVLGDSSNLPTTASPALSPPVTVTLQGPLATDKQSLNGGTITLTGNCKETFGLTKAVKIPPINGTFKGTVSVQVTGSSPTDVTVTVQQATAPNPSGGSFPLTATITYGNSKCTPLTANVTIAEGSRIELYDHTPDKMTPLATPGLVFTESADGNTLTAIQWANQTCIPLNPDGNSYLQTATGTLTKQ